MAWVQCLPIGTSPGGTRSSGNGSLLAVIPPTGRVRLGWKPASWPRQRGRPVKSVESATKGWCYQPICRRWSGRMSKTVLPDQSGRTSRASELDALASANRKKLHVRSRRSNCLQALSDVCS